MNTKIKKSQKDNQFEKPNLSIDKIADANTVIGESIVTVSGAQVIPLSSVTIVNLGGGGEYGDMKTYRASEGFKLAGGNGTVVTVKPKGFLVDDGTGCKLLKMNDNALDVLIDKTGELVKAISDNV